MTKDYVELEEIELVENTIKKLDYKPTPNELLKECKLTKPELGTILVYFIDEKMINIIDGRVEWIETPN